MNFYTYPSQTYQGQAIKPELVRCSSTFNHPVCYSQSLLLLGALIFTVVLTGELVRKVRYKRRIGVKLAIITTLLLNCITFLISNFDQALNFFDYGSLWLQGISLSLIVHYYTRKWVKLTGFEQRTILLRVLLSIYVVITTALFIVGIVQAADPLAKDTCRQSQFGGLIWQQLALEIVLIAIGTVLTVRTSRKLQESSLISPPRTPMIKRFWFLACVLLCRNAELLFQYYSFTDSRHGCAFNIGHPTLSAVMDVMTQVVVFFLPTLFTYFNFRTYKAHPASMPRRTASQEITLSQGLYFKYQE